MRKILEGLKIIEKYLEEGEEGDMAAEHDIIYAGGIEVIDKMSPEDKAKMDDLGWSIDETVDSYFHFT